MRNISILAHLLIKIICSEIRVTLSGVLGLRSSIAKIFNFLCGLNL